MNLGTAKILINAALDAKQPVFMVGSPGVGKALANDELVLTPTGFKPMGTLQVGEYVIGDDGKPTKILYVAPQGERKIYKVSFRDGTSVRCDEEHLWAVRARKSSSEWQTLTTLQLANRRLRTFEADRRSKNGGEAHRYNYCIPSISPVEFSEQPLPIHPYVVGVLLGDGCCVNSTISLTSPNKKLLDKVESLLPEGYKLSARKFKNGVYAVRIIRDTATVTFKQLWDTLDANMSVKSIEKHIPAMYQLSSIEQRQQLLDGLNDTDGCWTPTGSLQSFDSSSKQLHEDYLFVARSLGLQYSTSVRNAGYKDNSGVYHACMPSYRAFCIKHTGHNSIASIELDGYEEATCISIDNASKLFITNGFKPTHNSDITREIAVDREIGIIDLRLSQVDQLDLRGLPVINSENGGTEWATPNMWPTAGRGILLLDEITSASKNVEAAVYQLILDRKLGDYTLPEGWDIVAAGNKITDGAIVNRMSTALKNRFFRIDIESDLDTWVAWAFNNKVDNSIIAFLKYRPALLNEFEGDHFNPNADAFATQRSWTKLSNFLPHVPPRLIQQACLGMVGEAAATEYMGFRLTTADLPTFEELMANPSTARLPSNISAQFGVATMIIANVTTSNIGQVLTYLERLPAELTVMVLKQATKLKPMLAATKSFTAWSVKNQDLIF